MGGLFQYLDIRWENGLDEGGAVGTLFHLDFHDEDELLEGLILLVRTLYHLHLA